MFWRCFWKNIDVDVFDDVLQNAKHRAYDASNDVNHPPLLRPAFEWAETLVNITQEEKDVINKTKLSLLYVRGSP